MVQLAIKAVHEIPKPSFINALGEGVNCQANLFGSLSLCDPFATGFDARAKECLYEGFLGNPEKIADLSDLFHCTGRKGRLVTVQGLLRDTNVTEM